MKTKLVYIICSALLVLSCSRSKMNTDELVLPNEWKFTTGDSIEYSKPEFNDLSWKTIKVDTFWEAQNYTDFDGIAWYRLKLVIPSSLKEKCSILQKVRINLGRVDDQDDTYLNGQRIGGFIGWDSERVYIVPVSMINWDKENTIAIKVSDFSGNGGMWGKSRNVGPILLSDITYLTTNDTPVECKAGIKSCSSTLLFNFKIPIDDIKGNLKVKVYEANTNNVVFKKDTSISIGKKADSAFKVVVPINNLKTYRINYSFGVNEINETLQYETLLTYINTTRKNEHFEYPLVSQVVPDKEMPLSIENISFGGYLNTRLEANLIKRLLNIDEIGILECYYNRPGKQTWVGEYTGKYLHAASRVWRSTKNEQLKMQMDRIVDILIACQNEDGYLGTYIPENYWTDWDVWAHKYNILGLLSYYSVTGYKPALETSIKMGDLLCKTFGENTGQRNIIKSSGHMGMASTSVLEPMTELYRFTGDKKYLDFCNYIIKAYDFENAPKIITTLTTIGKVDKTANAKAYEMMSNLTGIVKLYQLTGNAKLLKAAENAWNDVAKYKLYITGTASEHEHFKDDYFLPAENENHMGEGCVTTTWIQFSQALYNLTGEPKYVDEIEKSVYNHLFAAENPQTGCVSYYTALQGEKPYRCNIDAHCCLASIPRGIAAIPELAITKSATNGLSINLYSDAKINSEILNKQGNTFQINCGISSNFPSEGKATIVVAVPKKEFFNIALHVPTWCKNYIAQIGSQVMEGVAGQYLNIEREWDKTTSVIVSFDLNTQILDGGKSYPGFVAIKNGPQILAFDKSLNASIINPDQLKINYTKLNTLSKLLLPKNWVGSQIYSIKAIYNGKPVDLKLVPFADAGQTGGEVRVWIKNK